MKQNSTRCQALTKCTDVPGKGTKAVDVTIEIFYSYCGLNSLLIEGKYKY